MSLCDTCIKYTDCGVSLIAMGITNNITDCNRYIEDENKIAKLNLSNDYGEIIYADTDSFKKISRVRKIINRVKQCPHLCCFCKYSTICDISWWKRGKIDARKICNCFRRRGNN